MCLFNLCKTLNDLSFAQITENIFIFDKKLSSSQQHKHY